MEKTADFVVIGGGILGASTAHFLAKKDIGKVVLLEKHGAGFGQHRAFGGERPNVLFEPGYGAARMARCPYVRRRCG